MKISVILPNYNGGKYLDRALDSFLAQTYADKELVLIDGKSSDNSHSIINHYVSTHSSIKWIKEEDSGISNAFNIGMKYVTGDIIGYMGGDDILYEGLFDSIFYHNKLVDFDAIYFDSYTYKIKEKNCQLRKCPNLAFTKENLLSFGTLVGWQNIYFKKEIYQKYSLDENNRTCMDYELYLRISNEHYLYLYVDRVASINIFDNNISSDQDNKQFLEACKVAESYSLGYNGNMFFSQKKKKENIFLSKIKKIVNRM